ncbi:MAG: NADP-dependent oxidoreductase [Alphaproteobacteria bacterium]
MNDLNRQWVLAREAYGEGMCLPEDCFGYNEVSIPEPGKGEILVRNVYFACEPAVHAMVRGVPGRLDPLPVGSVLRGSAAGVVVESNHPAYQAGELVNGSFEWADYTVMGGTDPRGNPVSKLPAGYPMPTAMTTLGMSGVCAYIGMFRIGKPKPGDVVVVSAAAGGIGSIAGQLARLAGATVIGITSSAEKARRLVDEVGYDAAIDYRGEDVTARLAELAPGGVNVFFDNAGGPILDAVLVNLANWGRIAICGGASSYQNPDVGVKSHMLLAQRNGLMQGFWLFDNADIIPEALERIGRWHTSGDLKDVIDIAEGFEAVPGAARGIFDGANMGKQLVRISDDPTS